MDKNLDWGFDWFECLFAVISLLAGILLLVFPKIGITGLAIISIILLLVAAIKSFEEFRHLDDFVGGRSWTMVIAGILEVVLAVILLFYLHGTIESLTILFALFVLVDAIAEIIVVSHLSPISKGAFWFSLLLDAVLIILGLLLLTMHIASTSLLSILMGILLLIIAINMAVLSFAHSI